jgi:hypothetical protein
MGDMRLVDLYLLRITEGCSFLMGLLPSFENGELTGNWITIFLKIFWYQSLLHSLVPRVSGCHDWRRRGGTVSRQQGW